VPLTHLAPASPHILVVPSASVRPSRHSHLLRQLDPEPQHRVRHAERHQFAVDGELDSVVVK